MGLERFVDAQDAVWSEAMAELRRGRKTTHWMWFVFPQLRGMGRSERAWYYGIDGADEARAYLADPVLGRRLIEALGAAMSSGETDPVAVFGPVDAAKLRSCLTLFSAVSDAPERFDAALDHFFDGARDRSTLRRLGH